MQYRHSGFTLIELMIVVAITGIPAAPSNVGDINYVNALTVVGGTITLTTSAIQSDSTPIQVVLTPNISTGAAIDWGLSGNGCMGDNAAEQGRAIECTGL